MAGQRGPSGARPIRGEFRADYSGQRPNCNAANSRGDLSFGPLAAPCKAR
jgi:hypothetical protein